MKLYYVIILLFLLVQASYCDKPMVIKTPKWYFVEITWGSYWDPIIKHARVTSASDSITILTTVNDDSIINIKTFSFTKILRDSFFFYAYSNSKIFDPLDTSNISSFEDGGSNVRLKIAANNMTVENSYANSNALNSQPYIKKLFSLIKRTTFDTTILD